MNCRHRWLPALRAAALCLLASALLAGCGGGGDQPEDPPEPNAGTQPVNCKTNPERCL